MPGGDTLARRTLTADLIGEVLQKGQVCMNGCFIIYIVVVIATTLLHTDYDQQDFLLFYLRNAYYLSLAKCKFGKEE